jgi:hypothetical protein
MSDRIRLSVFLALFLPAAMSACRPGPAQAWTWPLQGTRVPFFQDTPLPAPGDLGTPAPGPTAAPDAALPARTVQLDLADRAGDGVSCQDGSEGPGLLSPLSDLVGASFSLAGDPQGQRLDVRLRFAQQGDYRQALIAENPFLFRAGLEVFTASPALMRDPDWLPNNLSQLGIHGDWNSATSTLEGAVSRLDETVWHTIQVEALAVRPDSEGIILSLPARLLPEDARLAVSVLWWDAGAHAPICDFLGLGADNLPSITLDSAAD